MEGEHAEIISGVAPMAPDWTPGNYGTVCASELVVR